MKQQIQSLPKKSKKDSIVRVIWVNHFFWCGPISIANCLFQSCVKKIIVVLSWGEGGHQSFDPHFGGGIKFVAAF